MAHSNLGELIKTGRGEILSCTIKSANHMDSSLEFYNINFRKAVERVCGILFYQFEDKIYYPYSMEFRLIDNNILFLLKELKINNFKDLCDVLSSSFKREEGRDVEFFAVIYSVKQTPPFSYVLEKFDFYNNENVIRLEDG